MRKFIPEKAKLIPEEAELVFRGKIYDVFQWPQKMYDGSIETFEMLRRPDTVKIIGIVTDSEQRMLNIPGNFGLGDLLVITHQKQPGKDWFYDFPGGRVDESDKDELAAAKREMKEETGLEFKNWKLIAVEQPFAKIDWLVYTFVATDVIGQSPQKLDAGEKIHLEYASIEELAELAKKPDSQYLRFKNYDKIRKIWEIEELPELYNYSAE